MTVKECKQAYKDFLMKVTKHTKNSTNKYISYINKASKLPQMGDFWDRLAACDNQTKRIACVEELCDAIATALNNPYCPITEKDLRDSQSSAHVLLAFVSGQIWSKYKGVSVQFSAIFNHNALRSTFLSRLTSQDRIYDIGSFPIYIIHEMAMRKKIPLFDKMIAEIKFIYNANGDFFYFRDVERVMLATDGHAYLEKGGVIYPIFTEIPKKKPTEYRIAQAPTIADLSLDHDIPIQKKLKATIHSMPTLKVLSADIWAFKKEYASTHKNVKIRQVLSAYKPQMLPVDEDALIQETICFLDMLSLTVMQRNLNSSKSNRI